jgi:hypothetical protein
MHNTVTLRRPGGRFYKRNGRAKNCCASGTILLEVKDFLFRVRLQTVAFVSGWPIGSFVALRNFAKHMPRLRDVI